MNPEETMRLARSLVTMYHQLNEILGIDPAQRREYWNTNPHDYWRNVSRQEDR